MSAEEATPTTSYTKPTIDDYGDVKELTAGGQLSGHLDGSYPVGTAARRLPPAGYLANPVGS